MVIDSLSAIKYAKVKTVRNEDGIVVGFETEGDFPRYGNDDERADEIGVWLLGTFLDKIKKYHTYRDSEPTTSILTITSNVVYGKATGMMPDGRKAFTPFAPGASPSYGAEQNGLLASLNSVAKLPYHWALVEFPIRRRLIRTHWDIMRMSVRTIWFRYLTDTSIREHIT